MSTDAGHARSSSFSSPDASRWAISTLRAWAVVGGRPSTRACSSSSRHSLTTPGVKAPILTVPSARVFSAPPFPRWRSRAVAMACMRSMSPGSSTRTPAGSCSRTASTRPTPLASSEARARQMSPVPPRTAARASSIHWRGSRARSAAVLTNSVRRSLRATRCSTGRALSAAMLSCVGPSARGAAAACGLGFRAHVGGEGLRVQDRAARDPATAALDGVLAQRGVAEEPQPLRGPRASDSGEAESGVKATSSAIHSCCPASAWYRCAMAASVPE